MHDDPTAGDDATADGRELTEVVVEGDPTAGDDATADGRELTEVHPPAADVPVDVPATDAAVEGSTVAVEDAAVDAAAAGSTVTAADAAVDVAGGTAEDAAVEGSTITAPETSAPAAAGDGDGSDGDGDEPTTGAESRLTRWGPAIVLAVVLFGVAVVALVVDRGDGGAAPAPDIPLDVWAPYWALDDSAPELSSRIGSMREVSPFWYNVTAVDQIVVDPNAPTDLTDSFLDDARRADARLVPSIADALPAGRMASILGDPVLRRRHIQTIVDFAEAGDFDGIDLDYEQFAFADGRDTWDTTRPSWVAFIEQLAAALHADGRTLTVSVPPVYDDGRTRGSGFWVYDYGAIVDHVDRIRVMAYDYSVDEPGPIAPVRWVERAVEGAVAATGRPDKLVLGLPAYGRNWPVGLSGECPTGVEVPGRTSVTTRTIDELVARRTAVPVFDEQTAEWSFDYTLPISDGTETCVQTRQVHYVDGDGIRQRMDLARAHGLDGVSLWALGFEDQDVWDHILPTVSDDEPVAGTVEPATGDAGDQDTSSG